MAEQIGAAFMSNSAGRSADTLGTSRKNYGDVLSSGALHESSGSHAKHRMARGDSAVLGPSTSLTRHEMRDSPRSFDDSDSIEGSSPNQTDTFDMAAVHRTLSDNAALSGQGGSHSVPMAAGQLLLASPGECINPLLKGKKVLLLEPCKMVRQVRRWCHHAP